MFQIPKSSTGATFNPDRVIAGGRTELQINGAFFKQLEVPSKNRMVLYLARKRYAYGVFVYLITLVDRGTGDDDTPETLLGLRHRSHPL